MALRRISFGETFEERKKKNLLIRIMGERCIYLRQDRLPGLCAVASKTKKKKKKKVRKERFKSQEMKAPRPQGYLPINRVQER